MEKTLVFLKPDAVIRRYVGARTIKSLLNNGLKIEYFCEVQPSRDFFANKHYAIHKGKFFFKWLIDYVTSSPVILVIVSGRNAIYRVREILGPTLPEKASCNTIRGMYGVIGGVNVAHASDGPETAMKEIEIWKEIMSSQEASDWTELAKSYIDEYIDYSMVDSVRYREISAQIINNEINLTDAKNIFMKLLSKESDFDKSTLVNFAEVLVRNALMER